jgi:amino acid adenylation domain-containing protein
MPGNGTPLQDVARPTSIPEQHVVSSREMRAGPVPPARHPTDPAGTVVDWFRTAVAGSAGRVALLDGDQAMTYAELDAAVRRARRALARRGVRPGDRVVVPTARSAHLAIGVLATLGLGAAVAPVDLDGPRERGLRLVAEIDPKLVLTGHDVRPVAQRGVPEVPLATVVDEGGGTDARTAPRPEDLAYALPTSGSTGHPKVVAVPHAALANRIRWAQRRYPIGPGDTVLQLSSLAFDFSFWELLAPLCAGATVAIAPEQVEAEPDALADVIDATGTSVVHFVPSLLAEFLAAERASCLERVRLVLSGGEALTAEVARRLRTVTPAQVFNQYGPAEACVDALFHEVGERDLAGDSVPIGLPIDGVAATVLDERGAPGAEAGMLALAGACLAWGYVGRPAATAEAFVPNPDGPPGARMYRTGDRVRRRADGVLEFLGRMDDQVKIRGVRVEPAEVEGALVGHPSVRYAAVVAASGPDGPSLVAHVVCGAGGEPDELRAYLADRLPAAAVPTRFVRHTSLPRLGSGKVDRGALSREAGCERARDPADRPETATERRLAEIWADVLGTADLGRSADFFALGGNSLLAMRMLARVRKRLGVRVPVRAIFEESTLTAFGEVVDDLTQPH